MRELFPIFFTERNKSLIYLDSAATSQKPLEVIEAISEFYKTGNGTVHRAVYQLAAEATRKYDGVRELVRQFIGAQSSEEIIFTKGTTEAINLVASSFGKAFLQEGDEILVTETEHHSNIVPWQIACEDRKAILRVIPVDEEGEVDVDLIAKMITPKVKLIAIAHIANATGVIHPVSRIIRIAGEKGVKVLVDAAQSIAHDTICVKDLDPDFLVFSGHKMYGPTGIGILYGKKELLEKMPPYQGGGDMIEKVSFEGTVYQKTPLKFEAGTPGVAEVIGLGAAIRFLSRIGLQEIKKVEQDLTAYALRSLAQVPGLTFLSQPKKRASIISFYFKEYHSLDVGSLLDGKGIAVRTGHLCAQPALKRFGVKSVIRVSFGVYNTFEEIDKLTQALKEIVELLK